MLGYSINLYFALEIWELWYHKILGVIENYNFVGDHSFPSKSNHHDNGIIGK